MGAHVKDTPPSGMTSHQQQNSSCSVDNFIFPEDLQLFEVVMIILEMLIIPYLMRGKFI